MGESRPPVLLVTSHPDTAELYGFALEHAGFSVRCVPETDEAVDTCRAAPPLAVIVHFRPRHDPLAVGTALRQASVHAALLGLFSMQLPISTLSKVLESFDDVVMIPCAPDALVDRLTRVVQRKRT